HSTSAMSAMPMGMPGWPELAAWTASMARMRMALARSRRLGLVMGLGGRGRRNAYCPIPCRPSLPRAPGAARVGPVHRGGGFAAGQPSGGGRPLAHRLRGVHLALGHDRRDAQVAGHVHRGPAHVEEVVDSEDQAD